MRNLTINSYWVDENGDYVVDENGDKIIIGTAMDLEYDETFSGIAGAISKVRHLRSFNVRWSEASSEWHLIVNQTTLIGRYSSRAQALGVLAGLFRRMGANNDADLTLVISYMMSIGRATIDSSEPLTSGPVFELAVTVPGVFQSVTITPDTGDAWIASYIGSSATLLSGSVSAGGFALAFTGHDQSQIDALVAQDWTLLVNGVSITVLASGITSPSDGAITISDAAFISALLAETSAYQLSDITTTPSTAIDFLLATDWINEESTLSGFSYPQYMVGSADGTERGWSQFQMDTVDATDATFIAAYAAATGLPSGQQANGDPVYANGWNCEPRFPDMDYDALVDFVVSFEGTHTYSQLDDTVNLNLDIEKGFEGYDIDENGHSVPGPARAPMYYKANNPAYQFNVPVEQYNLSQVLHGNFIKLAQKVRERCIANNGSAPKVSIYNCPMISGAVQITSGQVDGTPRSNGSIPNSTIDELTENQKNTLKNNVMNNTTLLLEGGEVDGVWYPPLDLCSLLAFPYGQSTDTVVHQQIDSAVLLATALKERRDDGDTTPPTQIMTQVNVSSKGGQASADETLTAESVQQVCIDPFAGTDVSSWQWIIFNSWSLKISNTFRLNKAGWSAMSSGQQGHADGAWTYIWSVIEAQNPGTLPGYLSTAELTLSQPGFNQDTSIRAQWWDVYRDFMGERFIRPCVDAAVSNNWTLPTGP